MKARPKAAAALTRPAMPGAPTTTARPARATRRITVDLPVERYGPLRQWATDTGLPASLLVTALLQLAEDGATTRSRAEAVALAAYQERQDRRSVGQ
jgi:hypothetical protein